MVGVPPLPAPQGQSECGHGGPPLRRAPTALKRMLSKPGAAATVLPGEGQPPFFRSQSRPKSPSSTRSTRRRRAPPTAAGTEVATAVSPGGHGAREPEIQALPVSLTPKAKDDAWGWPVPAARGFLGCTIVPAQAAGYGWELGRQVSRTRLDPASL